MTDENQAQTVEDLMTKIQAFGLACYQHESGDLQKEMQAEIRAALTGAIPAPEGGRNALMQALEALENNTGEFRVTGAASILRAALAAQPVPLTGEQIDGLLDGYMRACSASDVEARDAIRAQLRSALAADPQADDWRKYATEREDTAQQVIERHRREIESLLRLLAADRKTIAELRVAKAPAEGDGLREAYEAHQSRAGWAESDIADKCSEGAPCAGEYRNVRLQDGWEIWQAASQPQLNGDEPACWVDGGDLEQLAKLGMGGVLGWADNGDDPRRVPLYTRQASGSARSEIETALLRSVEDLLAYAEDVLSNKEQLACFKPGVVQAHVKAAHAAIEAATSQPQPKGMALCKPDGAPTVNAMWASDNELRVMLTDASQARAVEEYLLDGGVGIISGVIAASPPPAPAQRAWVWNPARAGWEEVRTPGHWQEGALYLFGAQPEPLATASPAVGDDTDPPAGPLDYMVPRVAKALKEAIKGRGLTQVELARRLECTEAEVSDRLSGRRNLTLSTMSEICDLTGLRMDLRFYDPSQPQAYVTNHERALSEMDGVACPRCLGSGSLTAMSNGGPDAHEIDVDCPHCGGTGSARDAYLNLSEFYSKAQR